jgi:hypothetical protein
MIDNYAQAMALVERMTASVPIPARPTRQLVDLLRSKGASLGADPRLEIKKVFYGGDEGGIMCDVTPESMSGEVVVCSLTHLRVHPKHPLAGEIRAYQETRTRRLARAGGRAGITTFERGKDYR